MEPNVNDRALYDVIRANTERMEQTALSPDDEQSLCAMVKALRGGQRSVLIVETPERKLQYLFSAATHPEAVSMLQQVIDALVPKTK